MHVEMKKCWFFLWSVICFSLFWIGCTSLTWRQSIHVMVCVKSTETTLDKCRTCVPCPNEDVYEMLKEACPFGAANDCRQFCDLYQKNNDYEYIVSSAKNLNDYAQCHFNNVELKNVSITSTSIASLPSPSTATPALRGITLNSQIKSSPPTKEWQLSPGDIMLTVLCTGIFVVIVGALCRSGFRRRREKLKKKRQVEIEARRMSVDIRNRDEPPIRRMSVGPSEEPNAGYLCWICPRFHQTSTPLPERSNERTPPVEQRTEITTETTNNALHATPGPSQPPVQFQFYGNTNLFDYRKSLDKMVSCVLSQTKDLPDNILRWKNVFKHGDILRQIYNTIDPVHLMDFMQNILTEEQEQWVKQIKEREGNIRACKRLLIFVLSSKNMEWPNILNTALEEAGYPLLAKLLQNAFKDTVDRTGAELNACHEMPSERHIPHSSLDSSSESRNDVSVFTVKVTTV